MRLLVAHMTTMSGQNAEFYYNTNMWNL